MCQSATVSPAAAATGTRGAFAGAPRRLPQRPQNRAVARSGALQIGHGRYPPSTAPPARACA